MSSSSYVRFVDASGHVISVDGGSLFEVGGVDFGVQAGSRLSLGPLNFTLAPGSISPLLDQVLASGQTIAAVELFRTSTVAGATQVVAEDVFKDVGLATHTIDASTGNQVFTATYGGLVESVVAQGGPVTRGWNALKGIADNSLDTGIAGRRIGDAPSFPKDIASPGGNDGSLRYYVHIENARGSSLLGGSPSASAGWFILESADLGLSQSYDLAAGTSGKVAFGPVQIRLGGSQLDPVLLQALSSGTGLQVEIAAYALNSGTASPHLVDDYRFGGAAATSASTRFDSGAGSQTYEFSYGQEVIAHYTTTAAGVTTLSASEGWNAATNTALLATSHLVPAQSATLAALPPLLPQAEAHTSYVRLVDAAGHAISLDGGTLFKVDDLGFGTEAGAKPVHDPLSFTLGSSSLSPLLDQMLAAGRTIAEVDLLQTASRNGTVEVVAKDVFRTVGLTSDGVEAVSGAHVFAASYASLATTAPLTPFGKPDLAFVGQGADRIGCYVRIGNAQGASLLDGSRSASAGWLALDGADLGLSQSYGLASGASGKVAFGPVQIRLGDSQLDPVLFQALASGTGLQVEIATYALGDGHRSSRLLDDYRFGGAAATSAGTRFDGNDPSQTYGFSFRQEVIEHYTTTFVGLPILSTSEGWNADTGTALPVTSPLVPAQRAQLDSLPSTGSGTPSTPSFSPSALAFDAVASGSTVAPFSGATLSDPGTGAVETLTVVTTGGTFTGAGFAQTAAGTFVATGTLAEVNADLAAARFTDTAYSFAVRGAKSDAITATDTGRVAGVASAAATLAVEVDFLTQMPSPSVPVLANAHPVLAAAAGAATIQGVLSSITLSDTGTQPGETLTAVVSGGSLEGAGFTQTSAGTYVATGSVAEINADLQAAGLRVAGAGTFAVAVSDVGSVLGVASLHAATTTETIVVAPCFASGTLIRTAAGDVAVEALRVGELVRLSSGGLLPIRWLGHRRVDCRRHPEPDRVRPVRVRAHALGDGLPARDLVLSPEHALFLDGHLVPVHALVDGVSVVQEAWDRVTYHHVELDRHDVLLAEGLPAESYLDTGNRAQFANAPVVALHASFGPGEAEAEACAPLLLAGARLEALRAALSARPVPPGRQRLA